MARQQVHISLPAETLNKLDSYCKISSMTRSEVIGSALSEYLTRYDFFKPYYENLKEMGLLEHELTKF